MAKHGKTGTRLLRRAAALSIIAALALPATPASAAVTGYNTNGAGEHSAAAVCANDGTDRWQVTWTITDLTADGISLKVRNGNRKLVGWNVGSFDVPFVRKHLPGVASVLSYQSADLNAACFIISEAQGISYKGLKARAKEYAAEMALKDGLDEAWHDAGYDALASLYAWEYLKMRVEEGY